MSKGLWSQGFLHLVTQSGRGQRLAALLSTGMIRSIHAIRYGNSGFDRTHVFTVSYLYQIPALLKSEGWASKITNGWGISGVTVAESGQPYSVTDFLRWRCQPVLRCGRDFITNPILPIDGNGATSTKVLLQGTTGVNPSLPVLNAAAFGVPLLAPGQDGVPPCDDDGWANRSATHFETGFGSTGRNIFRGPFQTRFDFCALQEILNLLNVSSCTTTRNSLTLFNHPSFDAPNNNVSLNPSFRAHLNIQALAVPGGAVPVPPATGQPGG